MPQSLPHRGSIRSPVGPHRGHLSLQLLLNALCSDSLDTFSSRAYAVLFTL